MASVNKVILVGNVGRDPEIRYTQSGMAVCNISLATTSKRKDRNTGENIEDTQWHRVAFYDKLAEIVSEYVKKGHPLYVEGRITYKTYTDRDGVEKHSTDIIATEMQMLGGRQDGSQEPREPRQAPTPAPRTQTPRQAAPARPASGFDDMDDDIPF